MTSNDTRNAIFRIFRDTTLNQTHLTGYMLQKSVIYYLINY